MNPLSISCKHVVNGDMVVLLHGMFTCIKNNVNSQHLFLVDDHNDGYVYSYTDNCYVIVFEMPIPYP